MTEAYIRERCGRSDHLSRAFERQLIDLHGQEPLSRRELDRLIQDEIIDARAKPSLDVRGGGGGDPATQLRSRMADALYARMSGQVPDEAAREFMGVRMVDMARGLLEARGVSCRWDSPSKIVERMGQHGTSDFPVAMADAARRYLLDTFRAYPSPLKVLARPRSAIDFRQITVAKVSQNPQLLLVQENAEFTYGSAMEGAEAYRLQTYGRIFAITRQALVNDDLGMFTSVFQGWGRAGAELEANLLAGLISGDGGNLLDGNPLYSTARGNKAATGAAINVTSLSAARQAMRQMKDLDGFTPINATPRYLVVGAEIETTAEQVLAQINATAVGDVNPFSGKLELLVDPRMTGKSWRLFADPAQFATLEVARLAGQEDVFVDSQVGFDIDGIKTKARLDIGGAAIDWRGTYLNPGA
ncbi:MAG: Peptidase phage prohead [Microvirga sp.]|nr:Peptidase phage prohead [Microvirga sp.]